jgi:hypothetical protein
MIPIAVRGKRPLRSDFNYVSHGAAGPYLTQAEALEWVAKGFNLAVAAGPSRIVWLDIDDPAQHLPKLHRGLLMRTARGYAAPLRTDSSFTELIKLKLKENGYDCRDDVAYELVPLSVTCTRDHNLSGEIHLGPQQPCIDGGAHDYRVREFITPPSNPILSFRQFLSFVA